MMDPFNLQENMMIEESFMKEKVQGGAGGSDISIRSGVDQDRLAKMRKSELKQQKRFQKVLQASFSINQSDKIAVQTPRHVVYIALSGEYEDKFKDQWLNLRAKRPQSVQHMKVSLIWDAPNSSYPGIALEGGSAKNINLATVIPPQAKASDEIDAFLIVLKGKKNQEITQTLQKQMPTSNQLLKNLFQQLQGKILQRLVVIVQLQSKQERCDELKAQNAINAQLNKLFNGIVPKGEVELIQVSSDDNKFYDALLKNLEEKFKTVGAKPRCEITRRDQKSTF
ncbi:hypothetical protein FGO68_gene5153 [Halteria grandinella]|uniref:Uncharacterized protein n=1 Tax=Halteria grandinella TaxID=5974 RepID=A0A8J8NQ73_HALGN|nr:hypothetical protein FGO68_gene5153 [Halteria grandinella]